MADIFGVIADATRRELLQVLLERSTGSESPHRDLSVGELVERLGLSQPTVSKHLKVLREAGLVAVREVGQHRYYRLESSPLEVVEDWLMPFLGTDFTTDAAASARTPGAAAFAAWSGAPLPAPLRRAGETLQHPADAGAAVGRAVADATHGARHRFEEASGNLERRVIEPIKKKLTKD
ncbi:metalloregulator ArsR/SmtB family transcription factor [Salinibacterium sp. SYSU T00001]|uniref:ArsR/SmtB family transcription factor n=1 Tax=Homoserinimonas sedimenticola TaxID=2986805 RepID=UPI002235F6F6|nr:metalloregulator ArsR/SmtB family transcription factor [Salinibacterium sedimenticola]MCW4385947.1 metalloregulator ArsR/SmtB family transcription factor [Salinibacterium sedimenticola]